MRFLSFGGLLTRAAVAASGQSWAFTEVVNVANGAEGADRNSGIAAVKEKLKVVCKERGGTPDPESFEVVFERTNPNPDVPRPYYVDAKMKCDLP